MARWWSVAVVLCAAACSAAQDLPWWKTGIIYQIYPRSFKDSDGDGIGDLKGILQVADYFKEIGLDAVWLSPIFRSPMVDNGYDISDFTDIDPLFGTMEDFDALSAKLHDLGIKLLLDFVPNHSSDQHPWFQKSMNNDPDYKDFYIWRDPSGWRNGSPLPPNNWLSVFDGSSWEWSEQRKQFYYHAFKVQQPDLNYMNERVLSNMTAVLEFWMDKGVDGFRVDAVPWMLENPTFPDDPRQQYSRPGARAYDKLDHVYEMNQPKTFTLMKYWADFVYNKTVQDGIQRAVLLEAYAPPNTTMAYYGIGNENLEYPFNFILLYCNREMRAPIVKTYIDYWMALMPSDGVPNWVTGNHDQKRVADRYGPEMVDSINLLSGVLPGVKVLFNGEEIGMQDTYVRPDESLDTYVVPRDPYRTPFQWDSTLNAGFSNSSKTWLPVNPNYWWLNVDAQRVAESSHLKVFQAMAQARKDPVLQRGKFYSIVPNNDTMIVIRYLNDSFFVLVINWGSETQTFTSQNLLTSYQLDMDMRVVVGSINSGYSVGTPLRRGSISLTLRPKAAVLLRSTDSSASSSTSFRLSATVSLLTLLPLLLLR